MSIAPVRGSEPTQRELEVLAAWRDAGGDLDEAGRLLGISRHTVKNELANIRARLGVRKTWQAAVRLLA
jgi:DNA-binding CsgD family transcriptional regulator